MRHGAKLVLVLAATFIVGASTPAQNVGADGSRFRIDSCSHEPTDVSTSCASWTSAETNQRTITRFATRLAGDHTLDSAIVAEQVLGRSTVYRVHLQFASGAEQSFAVTAPPGGLQPELRDMSGDNVPNDVVLNSSLLHVPLLVLVNDGHDHLSVAASATTVYPDERRASGSREAHGLLALVRPGYKSLILANDDGLSLVQSNEDLCSSIAQVISTNAFYSRRTGRAPPSPSENR